MLRQTFLRPCFSRFNCWHGIVANNFRERQTFLSVSRLYSDAGPNNRAVRRENIYTIPNALTVGRITLCPFIGWSILKGDYHLATALIALAGCSDFVDGYLARKFNMRTVLGSILDPAADKILMTTLTISLTFNELIPVPLAFLIIGRDFSLGIMALYYRYNSLPPPRTLRRYWDMSIPSASVKPTTISKWNTLIQLSLMGLTTISPIVTYDLSGALTVLQWTCACTTVYTGGEYAFSKSAVKYL